MATEAATPVLDQSAVIGSRWWAHASTILLILFELGWILPWFQVWMAETTLPSLWLCALVMGGLMLVSYLAAALMNRMRLLKNMQLGVLIAILIAGLFACEAILLNNGVSLLWGLFTLEINVMFTALVTGWLWYRGFILYYQGIRPVVVWRRFRFGLVAFMFYIFYASVWKLRMPGLAWYIAFLFVGLMAVIFTRIAFVWVVRGTGRSPFDRRWLGSIMGLLTLTLLISGFAGSLLSGQYRMLLDAVGTLTHYASIVILFLASIPVILFMLIFYPLVLLLQKLLENAKSLDELPLEAASSYPYPYPMASSEVPSQVMMYATSIFCWTLFIVIGVILFLRARRAIVQDRMPDPEASEFILGRGEMLALLRKSLQDGWDDAMRRLRPVAESQVVQRIRRIYAELLALSAKRGSARVPWQTPLEFMPVLDETFPGHSIDAQVITQAYQQIRYGEYPETDEAARDVEGAFDRMRND